MSDYVLIAQEAVDYIEENIEKPISTLDIAKVCHMSEYYFNRFFSFMVGTSPAKYLLRRKLSKSAETLIKTNQSIADIAYQYGFEYTESYSRAFKNSFGVSPGSYRKNPTPISLIQKAKVITRDVITIKGKITLKSDYVYYEERDYFGVERVIDITNPHALSEMEALKNEFKARIKDIYHFTPSKYIVVAKCMGNGRDFNIYVGLNTEENQIHGTCCGLSNRTYSGSWYVKFKYQGSMDRIEPSLEGDINQWIKHKKEPLEMIEPGILIQYDETKITDTKNTETKITVSEKIEILVRINRLVM